MRKILKIKYNTTLLCLFVLFSFLSSCQNETEEFDDYFNQIIVGYWQLVSTENQSGEIYDMPYAQNITHFTEEGTYDIYHWNSSNSILNGPSSNYYFHWSYNSKKKELYFTTNEYFSVLDFTSDKITLKQDLGNGLFQIRIYEKLTDSEIESLMNGIYPNNYDNNVNTSSYMPSSLIGKYIHLYRSDGQKLIVEHLNSHAPNFINNSYISYTSGYEPYYEFEKIDSKSARYFLYWYPLTYSYGSMSVGAKQYLDVILTFDSSDNSHGTVSGSTWREAWNWNTNTEYKQSETDCSGTFYLGGDTDSNPNYNGNVNNSDSSNNEKSGVVRSIEISSVSDITSNSALINGIIDIEGNYDEIGVVCVDFNNSIEAYAFSLPSNVSDFKSKYSSYCEFVDNSNFSLYKTGLKSSKFYITQAYAIIGDKLYKSSSKSFTTK